MENLIIAINCVLPVFLIICVGALIRHIQKIPEKTFDQISNMAFRFLLPCSLFYSIYTTDLDTAVDPPLLVFLLCFQILWFLVGVVIFSLSIPNLRTRGAMIHNMFRANIAIVGVTMAVSMMGPSGVASMSVAIAVVVPVSNVLAVITLEACRGGKVELKSTLKGVAQNPLIWGCLLGVIFLLLGIRLPASVLKAVNQLGGAGSTMALVALGASFRLSGAKKNWKLIGIGTALRLIGAPAVAVSGAVVLGFRGDALGVVLLCSASSLAASSYPMAIARDSDHELTGQLVVSTSFLCCVTLFFWIFILRQLGLL